MNGLDILRKYLSSEDIKNVENNAIRSKLNTGYTIKEDFFYYGGRYLSFFVGFYGLMNLLEGNYLEGADKVLISSMLLESSRLQTQRLDSLIELEKAIRNFKKFEID